MNKKKKTNKNIVKNLNKAVPTATVYQIEKLYSRVKNLDKDARISLEFCLSFLFPTVWDNIMSYAKDCYTKGYIQGKEDAKNEGKRNN